MTFEYRDNDGARLAIDAVNASTYYGNEPVVALLTEHRDGDDLPVVYVPLDRVEEVVAGIRDAARQASGQQPDTCATCGSPFPVGHVCLGPEDPQVDLRRQYGEVLRRWGLLDEVNDPKATEEYAVTDLLAIAAPAAGLSDTQPANEAHPTDITLIVERRGATDWLMGSTHYDLDDRDKALACLARRRKQFPNNEHRLVRETTTWTVEEDETR